MSNEEFPQYVLGHDDGSKITVDQVDDEVAVHQTSQGTTGRGAMLLTANEAHEVSRQLEAAAGAAARFKPPEPIQQLPTNPTPDVATALRVLGLTPEQLVALKKLADEQSAAKQQA